MDCLTKVGLNQTAVLENWLRIIKVNIPFFCYQQLSKVKLFEVRNWLKG